MSKELLAIKIADKSIDYMNTASGSRAEKDSMNQLTDLLIKYEKEYCANTKI